ncbi:rhodanese-related sulfurtransferase, partial [Bacillus velezensis]
THECRVHPRNRYVVEHNLSDEEVAERLQLIEDSITAK